MKNILNYLHNEEEGQGMVEYALVVVLIAVAAVFSVRGVGVPVSGLYDKILEAIRLL